ncbi:MAG: nickel-responsive transcriptional regulator NikR [Thermodesulfobacteriota bacterium]
MSNVTRFGISMDSALLERFDRLIARKGYTNRSEAIRDLVRDSLVAEEWESGDEETVGAVSIVYDHDRRDLQEVLTRLQHRFHETILSTLHIHLDEHNCLEIVAARGKAADIRSIADQLISAKGVKHGKLSLTTTGRHLC